MMDIYTFGRELLRTKDLDPVYVLLYEARLGWLQPNLLERWLLAYWGFYHVGTASWIAEHELDPPRVMDYWKAMETAAGSKDWPRSSERRHFRGENARKSVAWLRGQGLKNLFAPLRSGGRQGIPSAKDVTNYVQTWVGFGPWIAFKVADMLERLGLLPIAFDLETAMYDSPTKAAQMLWEEEHGVGSEGREKEAVEYATQEILSQLGKEKAPPRYERPINVQEVETILCKFKAYRGGHYRVGEDIEHCKRGLLRFSKCKLSQRLYAGGRKGGLW